MLSPDQKSTDPARTRYVHMDILLYTDVNPLTPWPFRYNLSSLISYVSRLALLGPRIPHSKYRVSIRPCLFLTSSMASVDFTTNKFEQTNQISEICPSSNWMVQRLWHSQWTLWKNNRHAVGHLRSKHQIYWVQYIFDRWRQLPSRRGVRLIVDKVQVV